MSSVDRVVARVAGRPIRASDVERRTRTLPYGAAGDVATRPAAEKSYLRRWAVQAMVTEALIADAAWSRGLTDAPPDGSQADAATRRRLFEEVTAGVAIDERDARAYYDRNPELFAVPERRRVRQLILPDESSAREMGDRIAAGEEMSVLAKRHSLDPWTRRRGGDLGLLRRGELAGPLEQAIFAAPRGELVGPIRTEQGWHVARVESIESRGRVAYRTARAGIRAQLLAAARETAFSRWLDGQRRSLAAIAPDHEHPAHPRHGDPRHRH